jgi:hypothetical protein
LLALGIVVLAYSFAYMGIRDTESRRNAISVPPAAGGIALAGGIVLLFGKKNWEKKMPLVNLVIVLIVVGLVLGLINRYVPMASSIKTILNVVVVIAVLVWVLQATGLWGPVANFRVSR